MVNEQQISEIIKATENADKSINSTQDFGYLNKFQLLLPRLDYAIDSIFGGGYVLAFEAFFNNPDYSDGYGSGYYIGVVVFNNDNIPIGQPFYISNGGEIINSIDSSTCFSLWRSDKHTSLVIKGTEDGGFVVSWVTTNSRAAAEKQYLHAVKFSSTQDYTGQYVCVNSPDLSTVITPHSISISNLQNNGFAVSWTSLITSKMYSGIRVSIKEFDSSANPLYYNNFASSTEHLASILSIDYSTHTRMILLDGNQFSFAYHSINNHQLIANDCTYGPNQISCSQNLLLSQVISSFERPVVHLAEYFYSNKKTPIYVWEDKDANQNWQVHMRSYFADSKLHTFQVSLDEKGYHNVNPAVTCINNDNIIVVWHKFSIDTGLSAGIFLQGYFSNSTPWHYEPIKIVDGVNEYFSTDNFNSPSITNLNNKHYLISWLGYDNEINVLTFPFKDDSQKLSEPNSHENNLNSFAIPIETTFIISLIGIIALGTVYYLKSGIFSNLFVQDFSSDALMNENNHLLSGVDSTSTVNHYAQLDVDA